ncbi:DUF6531 domain-containing protein [Luteibacter sp. 22Crub2.1]|uniref:DUF6531 domain-containing protein n=1 Tax=Luteibacter sp. 22Crub2.1 TaxID=1283288 RepID=UPI0009A8FA87|nr:DUF6531 domain-containing protein [Luteibacter sp. 22Crub2.1]SKB92540.1 YD repeat-containing protein [Luteibacter sp. 22Crub2.1]
MKTVFGILCLFVMTMASAQAEEIWFALDPGYPMPPDLVHYSSAEDACRAGYAKDVDYLSQFDNDYMLAYRPPVWNPLTLPYVTYDCVESWTGTIDGSSWSVSDFRHIISVQGEMCRPGLVFDPYAGKCGPLSDYAQRRQNGDPNNDPGNHPDNCAGNPINIAIGNKFERQIDFADADGELRFERFYNGAEGRWRHSYGASLIVTNGSAILTFEDGRASIFTVTANVATAESNERGSLAKSGANWVYSSPTNETMTFNSDGQLTAWKLASGLTQKLTYDFDENYNNLVTVTDSRGHVLSFTEDFSSHLVKLTAGALTATYVYSDGGTLTSVTRALGGKSVSRSYVYDDPNNPLLLTGLIDEKGVRAATWTYDTQGRATSSQHSGGADKTTVSYADDGTTTVTNALGHVVTYKYALVAGTKQMMSVSGAPAPGCPISNSSFTYDARGQIATQTDALGHITAFVYDTQGRIISKTEAKGTAQQRVTTTTWDGTSFRPKTVTTADRVTTYTYDIQGRLLSTQTHSIKE